MTNTRILFKKLEKLEIESQNITTLDQKTSARVKENIKKTTIKNLKSIVKLIDINASKRISISYLYIYAKKVKPITIFNIRHEYEFKTITQQEIELRLQNDRENGLNDVWNHDNRLTEYNEFTRRSNQLIETLEAGKLEIQDNTTYGELLYELLGTTGQLLETLGIDPEDSITQVLLNNKIQELKQLFGKLILEGFGAIHLSLNKV